MKKAADVTIRARSLGNAALKAVVPPRSALAWLIGGPAHAPVYVASVLVFVLVAGGVALAFVPARLTFEQYWKSTLPVLTALIGYLFGRRPTRD